MKYKCIRRCHVFGKLWEEGEILDTKENVPYHFVETSTNEAGTKIPYVPYDPMKPTIQSQVSSLSEIAASSAKGPVGGFASNLEDGKVIAPKDFKRVSKK